VTDQNEGAAALAEQVDAAMAASRVFVAVIAESMEDIDSMVSPMQFRTLVIVGARGPLNVTSLADLLSVHPSNATRVCDRLVRGGLLARTQSVQDRRHLELTLTADGRKLVNGVMDRRRAALTRALSKMPSTKRLQFAGALRAFGDAAGDEVGSGPSQYGMSLTLP
jgi:DNA-binding MarR family transcriptional regulator